MEEQEKQDLNLNSVGKWLKEKTSTTINEEFTQISEVCNELSANSQELEKVNFDKSKVEQKLKSLVISNRQAYTKSLTGFIKRINPPEKISYESVKNFCNTIENELRTFNKRTFRNYFIMQNLIGDELTKIAKNIKKIDTLIKNVKEKIEKEKLKEVEELHQQIKKILNEISLQKENEKRITEYENKKRELRKQQQQIEQKKGELEQSKEFNELQKMCKYKENLHKRQEIMREELNNFFSQLKKALKKLNKIDNINLIKDYVEDPNKAIFEDEEMRILTILNSLKYSIDNNKIELKKEKQQKCMNLLKSELTKEYLTSYKEAYSKLNGERDRVQNEIEQNHSLLEKENAETNLKETVEKISETENRMKELSQKVNILEEIKTFEEKIKKITGFEVEIRK